MSKMTKWLPLLALTIACQMTVTLYADDSNRGFEIMKKVRGQSRMHKTQKGEVYMVIKDKRDRERARHFNLIKKINAPMTNSLIKFFKPANIKGTALLTESKDGDEDNDQWVYLPAFKTTKRLSTEEKNQSFMGSDFSYSDIAGRHLGQDEHTLMKEDEKYFYVRSIPKDSKDAYSQIDYVVSKKIWVHRRIVFYDKSNSKLKTLYNKSVKKIKGMYVVTNSIMKNHKSKGQTQLQVKKIDVGIPVTDSQVSFKGLKSI
ncbi:outer membrane lipoprotein-sorting protein [bacterium]|jgi:hypothetical protein|nr:outer membrane lipoprotein-sorting protein [bacterium]